MGGLPEDGRGSVCTASLENVLYGEEGDAKEPLICAHSREWRRCCGFLVMVVVWRDQVRSSAIVTPRNSRH